MHLPQQHKYSAKHFKIMSYILLHQTSNPEFAHKTLSNLPKKRLGSFELYQWQGHWYFPSHLEALLSAQSHFQAESDDIILASSMKTGTVWMKALITSIMHNGGDGDDDDDDPLLTTHTHDLIPGLEVYLYKGNPSPDFSHMSAPRQFATHLPYAALPASIKNSGCKIVYITRNPKDTFVSLWHFMNFIPGILFPMQETFDSFCDGFHAFGPFFDHVVEYWKESRAKPDKILFVKYEELKNDPKEEVKRLASFLGKPFGNDEQVEKVLWRCSLERLKNLEVNMNGVEGWAGMPKCAYFRKGAVGDWKNYLSEEKSGRLDRIARVKLDESGLELDSEECRI